VTVDDGTAQAMSTERRGPRELALVITEGRYHQVRRMLNAVRLPVQKLHREAIGSVVLDVPLGASRRLSDEEVRDGLCFSLPLRQGPGAE